MKLKKWKENKILEQVAQQHGISVEEVRAEIQRAIEIGMANPDSAVQARWKLLCKDGKVPTPDELIKRLSQKVKQ